MPTAEHHRVFVRDMRRRGAVIVTIFGLVWALAGASGLDNAAPRNAVMVGALAVAAGVAIFAWRSASIPAVAPDLPANWERRYNLINVAQFVAIAATVAIFVIFGMPGLIPPVVCLIVGLHFLPLAEVFRTPTYRLTGFALVAVAVGGAATVAVSDETARAVTGLGAALVLWLTAVLVTSDRG